MRFCPLRPHPQPLSPGERGAGFIPPLPRAEGARGVRAESRNRESIMFLGIEIGGTKLQLGLGRGDGTLSALWRGTVNPDAGSEGIRKQIVAAIPELLAKA